jgi:putative membrane protein
MKTSPESLLKVPLLCAAILAGALAQPALATDAPVAGAAPQVSVTRPATAPVGAADKNFFTQASGGGLYEVEVSRIAAMRTKNPDLKAFAEMLVNDHSATNAELKQLAESKGVALPTEVPAEKKMVIARLEKSKDFDRDFIRQVGLADHKANIALFEKTSKDAKDAEVRAFSAKKLPTLKEHLAQAEKLSRGKQIAHEMTHPSAK